MSGGILDMEEGAIYDRKKNETRFGVFSEHAEKVELCLFDEHGKELGREQRGEIRVNTPSLTIGYVNDPEKNKACLQGGWLHTGDLGLLDKNGKLFIYGRMTQYVEAEGGEKVYLFDIANRLREDPAVKEALACRLAAEDSPLVAHVVLKEGLQETEQEVLCRLDNNMSAFLPAGLHIDGYRLEREQLKINIVGKTDRHYYTHLLSDYFEIRNGELHAVNFL